MKSLFYITLIVLLASCMTPVRYNYEGEDESRLLAEVLGKNQSEFELITLALNDQIRADLDERIDPKWDDRRKIREIRKFLYGKDELNISYDASATRTAIDTYESRKGNCLALTTLFIAAGRYVGLDAHYRSVDVKPMWDHKDNTMIRYEHIIASGKLNGADYTLDFLPKFDVEGLANWPISDLKALALFYNNLGVENIVQREPGQAIVELRKSLALDPSHSSTWSNMGAALFRDRSFEQAEFSLQRALRENPNNYSALSNLVRLYQSQGRDEEAENVRHRVQSYHERNPYYLYFQARMKFDDHLYDDAISLLKKSIRKKRTEPMFHQALAETYLAVGAKNASLMQLALAEKYREVDPYYPEEKIVRNKLIVHKARMTHIR